MRCILILSLTLATTTAPTVAQTVSSDPQMTQTMLKEIHELRQDLRMIAATIQRVQIVMYRHHTQAAIAEKEAQRLDHARNECKQAQAQQRFITTQIEPAEDRKRNDKSESNQQATAQMISQLQSSLETLAAETQQCQVEQVDAETQFRVEQGKMIQLQDQLDQLEQILTGQDVARDRSGPGR